MFLKDIWEKVKNAENIDVYITIIITFFTIFLSVFIDIEQVHINILTLAILCMLITTNLVNRKQLENKFALFLSAPSIKFANSFPSEFDERLREANSIFISGVSLTRTITTYYSLFENKIQEGCSFKFLLVNPNSKECAIALKRHRAPESLESLQLTIDTSLKKLNTLKKISPNIVEIRIIDMPLAYGCFAVDPDNAAGILFIENYPFKTENGSLPRYTVDPLHEEWFEFFKNEINLLWDYAKEFNG